MDRLNMETANITDKNIEKILELFPNVGTEIKDENGKLKRAIDFEKLKQELSEVVVDGEESYDFTWVGKKEAMIEANRPIRKTLRPQKDKSLNWDTTENIYIEGDNLEALKLLQESYLGKIKMIYIDPPYNTGNDFIYRDNFTQDKESYDVELGTSDAAGNKLIKNSDTNGRFHSDWCSMIYSRLKLARNLLSDDGLIFISIDDNEIRNLKNICDEIFGGENFVENFIWEKTQHFGRQKLNSYNNADYILCYARNILNNTLKELLVEKLNSNLLDAPLYNASNNVKDLIFPVGCVKFNIEDGIYEKSTSDDYELKTKVNVKNGTNQNEFVLSFKSRWSPKTVLEEVNKGTTFWVKTSSFAIRAIYAEGKVAHVAPKQIIFTNEKNPHCAYSRFGYKVQTSETASKNLEKIMDDKSVFSYPKPVGLLSYIISLMFDFKRNEFHKDFTILDFFSGSSTTAHACMLANANDGGHRKFIMVQLPEKIDDKLEAFKSGYRDICEIGEERIRRAGKKIQEEKPDQNIDVGFRVFKIDDSNMKDVFYSPVDTDQQKLDLLESNIKDDRTDEDLLYACLLEWGVELSLPHTVKTIEGIKVHLVNAQKDFAPDLVACFEKDIPESVIRKIAEMKPTNVVFRDISFAHDDNKINVEEIFKLITPDTRVKVL